MPELPEVEVLARHLRPVLRGKIIRSVRVSRAKILHPTSEAQLKRALTGAKFKSLSRRGKYLLFDFQSRAAGKTVTVLGHLGMTGRMFVAGKDEPLPKHAAVVFELNRGVFVFEDTRYFGRMTLDLSSVAKLGPEPAEESFSPEGFSKELKRSRQPIKVKLLDQSLVAGVGNIYASEALYRAGISPKLAANRLTFAQVKKLHGTIRQVLAEAIECGSTIPLNFTAGKKSDGLFYFGRAPGVPDYYEERLLVYDRAGKPCFRCKAPVKRIVQAARSTFYCSSCQKS
ncbi:MAG TPA: bifunctional DNA-formamidopyrimidine glycosylase/DNA-(apurinic or apyrimidinic site) lyase [Candidatus Acidoferrales bacterium]|jgi:formamidopyrimidine-DNA glycosylase|nr:bifunctional DNA-formamidopyrimidine glycosylase/DNA-(apurinic or apyrimidinic site) lyase [Candidatus Acidoferrales bacterium]